LRCFISIELPDDIKQGISGFISKLKEIDKDIKWVKGENLHLTLKFLGEIEEQILPEIKDRLLNISKRHSPFDLRLKGIGAFPSIKRPRVIWIGIEDSASLINLQSEVEASMSELGFQKENRFEPHLTIGRLRGSGPSDALIKGLSFEMPKEFGLFRVESIYIMKSELSPKGPDYYKIVEIPLKKLYELS